jgi:hypothetical protein
MWGSTEKHPFAVRKHGKAGDEIPPTIISVVINSISTQVSPQTLITD